jgi:peptide chain release factor 3
MDREGKDAFDLMEVTKAGTNGYPLSFPIGMGYDFQGIYNLWEQNINYLVEIIKILKKRLLSDVQNPELEKIIGQNQLILYVKN